MVGGLQIGGRHGGKAVEQKANAQNAHGGHAQRLHFRRSCKQGQNLPGRSQKQQGTHAHNGHHNAGAHMKGRLHAPGLCGAVVKAHNGQNALDQPVHGHGNHLLHLEIYAEKCNGGGGVACQKQIDKNHRERGQGVHHKRGQAQHKYAADHFALCAETVGFHAHLLFCAEKQPKRQQHGKNIAHHTGKSRACNAHLRKRPDAEDQQRVKHKVYQNARNL